MNYRDYFKGKKITVVGLGENNKALADIEFLAKAGAEVLVVDSRSESDASPIVEQLKPTSTVHVQSGIFSQAMIVESAIQVTTKKEKKDWRTQISFSFGKYKKAHFENRDLIVRDIDIPLDLPYFKEALHNNIPVEVAEALFVKLAPPITLVGVTGTCGKTTVSYLIHEILKRGFASTEQKSYFIDPHKGSSALSLLAKIKRDDIVLIKLAAPLLKELEGAHISPHIAVVTNIYSDHFEEGTLRQEYLASKEGVFKHQTYNNFLVANDATVDFIKEHYNLPFKAKILRTSVNLLPENWVPKNTPYYTKENMALALRVAEILRVKQKCAEEAITSFKGVKGRGEYIKKVRGVGYYNDGTSGTPYSTLATLKTVAHNRNVVLIFGGPDYNWSLKNTEDFLKNISQYVHTIILIPGSGTVKLHKLLLNFDLIKHIYAHSVYDAIGIARDNAGKEDVVVFSPGFPAKGLFRNKTERAEHFVWALRGI